MRVEDHPQPSPIREGGEGRVAAIAREVRKYPFGYSVMGVFMLAGPVVTHFMFPEAPLGVGIVGGLAFGLYAAICAVPEKFL